MESKYKSVGTNKLMDRKTTRTQGDCHTNNEERFSFKQQTLSISNAKKKFSKCNLAGKVGILVNSKVKQINNYVTQQSMSQQKLRREQGVKKKTTRFQQFAHRFPEFKGLVSQKVLRFHTQKDEKRVIPSQLYNEIKHVFKYLQVLKNYGFSQKKIVKWMNSFLSKKGQLICDIFMKSYLNKKSLQNSIIYQRLGSLECIIQKMQQQASKLSYTQILFLLNQIKHFKNYVQEIVIKKTQSNLNQMFHEGILNPMFKFCQDSHFNSSAQIVHFIKDLKSIQDRYGQLESVSKFNRFMFKEVLKAEQKFVEDFYQAKKQNQN